jgi:hypothetical protein
MTEAKYGGRDMRSCWLVAATVIVAFCVAGACGGAVPEGDAAAFCPAYEEYQSSLQGYSQQDEVVAQVERWNELEAEMQAAVPGIPDEEYEQINADVYEDTSLVRFADANC